MIQLSVYLDEVQPWVRAGLYGEALGNSEYLRDAAKAITNEEDDDQIDEDTERRRRISMQKSVLILETLLGLTGGRFRYRWDVYGPYSSQLADAIDQLNVLGASGYSAPEIPADEKKRVFEAVTRVDEIAARCPDGLPPDEWMEIVSSVQYIENAVRGSIRDEGLVQNELKRRGKRFKETDVKRALEVLRNLLDYSSSL